MCARKALIPLAPPITIGFELVCVVSLIHSHQNAPRLECTVSHAITTHIRDAHHAPNMYCFLIFKEHLQPIDRAPVTHTPPNDHREHRSTAPVTASPLHHHANHDEPSPTVTNLGGGERDRTDDPLLAKQVLSQLSYTPQY